MNQNSYRIRTNISQDQVVRAKLTQDIDFLEILSLKINQEDTYKLHVSNYGIIVGRVLANDAFGIPNAKVSVFIPLTDEDAKRSEILNIYPYRTIETLDEENRKYNLLPSESEDICYRAVGTFPSKRLVLDNDDEIEVYEKYWKYTTVTNNAGDYMIYGVPTGMQELHVDIDLSDIGVLSQKPRDFIYKGYNMTQFDNANQFKEGTNLNNLTQLLTQNNSVYVYPFWGDADVEEVAITRCDVQVQYKFEPTCVFMGSLVSDDVNNSINDKCNPSKFSGYNRNLVAGEGTIEMIRKTPNGLVEEHQIQGNHLIDSNGVWCYQIPMNLDYIATDEFGNIIPTDNPNKGIPTRASVRFRISMQDTESEAISRHRAKYLVPNYHKLDETIKNPTLPKGNDYALCYEFGSATPDEYFRDLYWNKVYSVKNYIPRLQRSNKSSNNKKYSAIRTVNASEGNNPFPFNNARFHLFFSFKMICIIMEILISLATAVNSVMTIFGRIANSVRNKSWYLGIKKINFGVNIPYGKWIAELFDGMQGLICGKRDKVNCISFAGLSETQENLEFAPGCAADECLKCKEEGCEHSDSYQETIDNMQQSLSLEYDNVNLDFYNDWVNGCLYMPLWFWKKTKKRSFLWGLIKTKGKNRYCDCDEQNKKVKRLRLVRACALDYDKNYKLTTKENSPKIHKKTASIKPNRGIIKQVTNKAGLNIYYYAPGVPTQANEDLTDASVEYVQMYATDIILLGSLNSCDLDNLPQAFKNLPSTTANIPFIATVYEPQEDGNDNDDDVEDNELGNNGDTIEVSGMDWMRNVNNGLFMDLKCAKLNTKPKTCINLYRLSELGVSLDMSYEDVAPNANGTLSYEARKFDADGMITRYEIDDHESRAMFASLNHNGLQEKVLNPNTNYQTYKLEYCYPVDFDGHLQRDAVSYTKNFQRKTYDELDLNYINYRFGITSSNKAIKHYYGDDFSFPLYKNSFYFYFGLKEGNTAMDRFNTLFYASCYKNDKTPFSISYTTESSNWCPRQLKDENGNYNTQASKDYAALTLKMTDIKLPYSYVLYDNTNREILREDNITVNELRLGYKMLGSNRYEKDDNNSYIKDAYLCYTQSGRVVTPKVYLQNGKYIIEVTDANHNTIKEEIIINPNPLNVNIQTIELGTEYLLSSDANYNEESQKNSIVDGDLCGEIQLKGLSVDGKELSNISVGNVQIKDVSALTENNDVVTYQIACCDIQGDDTLTNNTYKLKFTIQYNGYNDGLLSSKIKNIKTCLVDENTIFSSCDNGLLIEVWVPGEYRITVAQYCGDTTTTNDNIIEETLYINNGKPFVAFLNEMPIEFIDFNILTPSNDAPTNTWANLHENPNMNYPKIGGGVVQTLLNGKSWSKYIDVTYETQESLNNNIGQLILSEQTKLDAMQYKLKSFFSLCNATYITDSNNTVSITLNTVGGKQPIMYNGIYPNYSEFKAESYSSVRFPMRAMRYDLEASVQVAPSLPNIVKKNYTQYENLLYPTLMYPSGDTNSYQHNKLLAEPVFAKNYFAAFTNNGGYNSDLSEVLQDEKYISILDGAKPNKNCIKEVVLQAYQLSGETNFVQHCTVDKRLDYELFVNYMNHKVYGKLTNALCLAYDEKRNIVSEDNNANAEYIINYNNGSVTINDIENVSKQIYDWSFSYNKLNEKGYLEKVKQSRHDLSFHEQELGNIDALRPEIMKGWKYDETSTRVELSFTNNSYPLDVNYFDISSGDTINVDFEAIAEEGEQVNVTIPIPSIDSLITSEEIDKPFVHYSYLTRESCWQMSNEGNIYFSVKPHKIKDHKTIVYAPLVIPSSFLNDGSIDMCSSFKNFMDEIQKNEDIQTVDRYQILSQNVQDCKRSGEMQNNIRNGALKTRIDGFALDVNTDDKLKYIYESGNISKILLDSINSYYLTKEQWDNNFVYLMIIAEYINNSSDNLTKNIVTVGCTKIIVPPYQIECEKQILILSGLPQETTALSYELELCIPCVLMDTFFKGIGDLNMLDNIQNIGIMVRDYQPSNTDNDPMINYNNLSFDKIEHVYADGTKMNCYKTVALFSNSIPWSSLIDLIITINERKYMFEIYQRPFL